MMNRIIKAVDQVLSEDELSIEEVRSLLIDNILPNLSKLSMLREWAVRDDLIKLTEWGFYRGDVMAIIDEEIAGNIVRQLIEYVPDAPDFFIKDLYDLLYHYEKH